ncbi:hypothetical protein [Chryseobacterium gallinarum]|uniref:Immunity protein 63 domain-containing protein n=1 Tax=Chryseobacterium gallinarum TaxID=1324352 RepID=A0ABX6KUE0_CHRGL|nr:hypothetical protein [Chryseobacterium gallinarum]QIY92221.1 hypothetical protein FOB44_16815 [Chryseobacterium gallinarum]
MNELEELTREIREKLPRLKELTNGTIIRSKMEDWRNFITVDAYYEIGYSDEYGLCSADAYHVNIDGYTYNAKSFEVIGKDPMLNDVMEWLQVKSQLDFELADKRYLTHFLAFKLSEWDLSKPYLKDQSPELINFLHSLIKTKQ